MILLFLGYMILVNDNGQVVFLVYGKYFVELQQTRKVDFLVTFVHQFSIFIEFSIQKKENIIASY